MPVLVLHRRRFPAWRVFRIRPRRFQEFDDSLRKHRRLRESYAKRTECILDCRRDRGGGRNRASFASAFDTQPYSLEIWLVISES